MHGHRALRRVNPVAPSVQPPGTQNQTNYRCCWSLPT
jgi:hypothetical protein